MEMKISKNDNLSGTLRVPGDKSISHRSVIFSALGTNKNKIKGFLESEDCLNTLKAFQAMGVDINKVKSGEYRIQGVGLNGLQEPSEVINCGNSGTLMRILTGLLAGQDFYSVLSGDSSLRSRPMDRIITPLSRMGAKIWSRKQGLAPLSINGQSLTGIEYELPVASAQVKSSILLAGLYAQEEVCVIEPGPSRDHTERMLKACGVPLEIKDNEIYLSSPENLELKTPDIRVPGDISSAAYFIAAAVITDNSEIEIEEVGLNSTRSGFIEVIEKMKGKLNIKDQKEVSGESMAGIEVQSSDLQAIEIKGSIIPRLIDEIPIISVLATQARGTTVIREAEELRVKETDRIEAMVTELKKLGANIEELEDGMVIKGPTSLTGDVEVNSYNDHRVAMSLAIAGLLCEKEITIKNSDCINTSFPEFENLLAAICEE